MEDPISCEMLPNGSAANASSSLSTRAREGNGNAKVYTHGGRNRTELDAVEWAQNVAELGAGEILLTSMDADGTKRVTTWI